MAQDFNRGKPLYKNINSKKVIEAYLQLEKKFLSELCAGKVEDQFNEKFNAFSRSGYYLPKINGNKLYIEAIKQSLPHLNKKLSWMKNEINSLARFDNFKSELSNLKVLKKKFDELVTLNSDHYKVPSQTKRLKIISKYKFIEFREDFNAFLRSISFLRYADFPINYFELRKSYDSLLDDSTKESEREIIYMKRKIFEDGAQDSNHTRSDFYLRSVISMTIIRMEEKIDFLPPEIFYDLEYLFKALENTLERGVSKHRERMKEWYERTEDMQKYYNSFLELKEAELENFSLLVEINKARQELKEFVYKKQASVYEFWSKQNEVMQALYSLDTILQNEVGGMDGSLALDRQDVIQVVINRLFIPQYLQLNEKDDLYSYLTQNLKKNTKQYPWLNVLFKQGEFSFTYFFLSASSKVFCPAQNPTSKKLRMENLPLIIDKLQNPDWSFPATRYFSRASMTGRIDMDTLWPKHTALAERMGPELTMEHSGYKDLLNSPWEVIYDFKDSSQKQYWVVRIKENFYTMDPLSKKLYYYRDPHLFRYFQSRYL